MTDPAVRVPCPYCKEMIIRGAIKCRHCQSEIKVGAMLPTEYAIAQALSEPHIELRQPANANSPNKTKRRSWGRTTLYVIGSVLIAAFALALLSSGSSTCQSVAEEIADQFGRNLETARVDARQALQTPEGKQLVEAFSMSNTAAALELALDPTNVVTFQRMKLDAAADQRNGIQTQCTVRGVLRIRFAQKGKTGQERDFDFTSSFAFSDKDGLSIVGLEKINQDAQNLLLKHIMIGNLGG